MTTNNEFSTNKIIHQVDSLTVYEVKEEELEILKQGPKNRFDFLLQLSILSIGISISCGITLLTGIKFPNQKMEVVYYTILGISLGLFLITLILYFLVKRGDSFEKIVNKIIERNKI